jgi:hypothetical protein
VPAFLAVYYINLESDAGFDDCLDDGHEFPMVAEQSLAHGLSPESFAICDEKRLRGVE